MKGPRGHVWALVWQYLGPTLEPEFSLIWKKKQEKAFFVAGLLRFFNVNSRSALFPPLILFPNAKVEDADLWLLCLSKRVAICPFPLV